MLVCIHYDDYVSIVRDWSVEEESKMKRALSIYGLNWGMGKSLLLT